NYNGADVSNPAATKGSNDWVIHAGLTFMDFDPFINWRVSGTDNQVAGQPSNKGGQFGLRYHWGEWTPFAAYNYEQYAGNTIYRAYGFGFGRTMKAAEAVKLAYSIGWFRQSQGAG